MKLKDYEIEYYDAKSLSEEITASNSVENFTGLKVITGGLAVNGSSILNENDLNDVFVSHNPLETYKGKRYAEIDEKTKEIISRGFVFDNKTFSLSMEAQSNLTNIMASREIMNQMGSFPLQMSTKDNSSYMLAYVDVISFWGAGVSVVKGAYNSGTILKELIKNATTIEEVNLIIDTRE